MAEYDLAVVGAGLGGITAAALASMNNQKTIVLEPGESVGGALRSFRKDDFLFSPGPVCSFGFERGGVFQLLNEKLGTVQNASVQSLCYQIALPDRRITVSSEHSETLEELRREFPNEIDSINKFYANLRKRAERCSKSRLSSFIAERRSAEGFLSSYRFSREFSAFLDVQSNYFFRKPAREISLNKLIMLGDSAPFTVSGGFRKLAEHLVDVLLRNGGKLHYRMPAKDIFITSAGVSLPRGTINARNVLINMSQETGDSLLCVGFKENVLPESMVSEVICLPDYSRPDQTFTLSVSSKNDENAAPRGMRSLSARFSWRSDDLSIHDQVRHVSSIIPFLTDFALFAENFGFETGKVNLPEKMRFQQIRKRHQAELLYRSSLKSVYSISDGAGTPAEAVSAAKRFLQKTV